MRSAHLLLLTLLLLVAAACARSTPPADPKPATEFIAEQGPANDEVPPTEATGQMPMGNESASGPLTCDQADARRCRTDADCACGKALSDGACAFGTAACIDTSQQCPDFCSGITGAMRLSCVDAQCVQAMGQPPGAK